MSDSFVLEFDGIVRENLERLGFDFSAGKSLGAAVSGGADSVSLLLSLCRLGKACGFSVKVITVNHNIRPAEESAGDAAFVAGLCRELCEKGYPVSFCEKVLEPGLVAELAREKGIGMEAAARILRYRAFEEFSESAGVGLIALAHNKNDQVETLLMRFLQGSGASGLGGIRMCRDRFVRPLLTVSRTEIEEYVRHLGYGWRTDSTNFDLNYLRNRVRNELVPFLREKFPGFETALISGAEKSSADDEVLSVMAEEAEWVCDVGMGAAGGAGVDGSGVAVKCSRKVFCRLKKALRIRAFYNGLDLFCSKNNMESRFPYRSLALILGRLECEKKFSVDFVGFSFCVDDEFIYFKKRSFVATDSGFFVIIKQDGVFSLPFGEVCCSVCGNVAALRFDLGDESFELEKVPVPFCIRSVQPGDRILAADGTMKPVLDILSGWHAGAGQKRLIPVIQDLSNKNQNLIALAGRVCGLGNWIVRG